jgi:hypothetical protein
VVCITAIPVATLASAAPSGTPAAPVSAATVAPTIASSPVVTQTTSVVTAPVRTPVTTGSQPTDATVLQRVQRSAGFAQLVQTATGKHILLTSSPQPIIHTPTAAAPTANTTGEQPW